jgi:hypothetical protein
MTEVSAGDDVTGLSPVSAAPGRAAEPVAEPVGPPAYQPSADELAVAARLAAPPRTPAQGGRASRDEAGIDSANRLTRGLYKLALLLLGIAINVSVAGYVAMILLGKTAPESYPLMITTLVGGFVAVVVGGKAS